MRVAFQRKNLNEEQNEKSLTCRLVRRVTVMHDQVAAVTLAKVLHML